MMLQNGSGFLLEIVLPHEGEMSDEEFYAFCLANKHIRIERDENKNIIIMPPAGGETSRRHIRLSSALDQWNTSVQLGEIFDSSAGFSLPDDSMRSPDLAWISYEKWNSLTEEQKEHFIPFAPDFLVEVMSPSDLLFPAQEKMLKWIRNGTRLAWLIAPKQQLAFIYRADGTVDKMEGFDKKLSGEDVLPGFEFDLSALS